LDELLYDTDSSLDSSSSFKKAQAFFKTCQISQVDDETMEHSNFIDELVAETKFAMHGNWDQTTIQKFHDALTYLTKINFNPLFTLQAEAFKVVQFMQPGFVDGAGWTKTLYAPKIINYVEFYQKQFGLDLSTAQIRDYYVREFYNKLKSIMTYHSDPRYFDIDPTTALEMRMRSSFSNISMILGSNQVMN